MKIAVQIDLDPNTFVSGGLAGDGKLAAHFGFLHLGRLSIYLAGRNEEVADSARDLAKRIAVELERIAETADQHYAPARVDVAGDPVPHAIPSEEIPH